RVAGQYQACVLADGWPAALRLLGRLPEPGSAALSGYVAEQVIPALSPTDLEHLTDLAVVDDWSPQACTELLAVDGAERLLCTWERMLPVDRHGRIHPLVRRWFGARLAALPGRSRALHRRASLWKTEQGDLEAALSHAIAAADLGLAAPLLRRVSAGLLLEGRTEALDRLLEQVPDTVLELVPEMLLQVGEALRRGGSPGRAGRWLRIAVVGFAANREPGGLYRAFCRLALTHADLGEWTEVEAALQQVGAEAGDAAGLDRAEALRALAQYQVYLGQNQAAAAGFQEAAELFLAHGDAEGAGTALTGLGAEALVALERLPEALSALREAQRLVGGATACEALLAEVQILTCQRHWDGAQAVLKGAAPDGAPQRAAVAWLQAWLAHQRGDLHAVRRLKAEGDQQAAQAERSPALLGLAALTEGRIALAEGRLAVALACGRQTAQAAFRGFPLLRLCARLLVEAAEQAISGAGGTLVPKPPAGRLRVQCLGAFRLFAGEQEVPLSHWGRAQVRGLLQYLLLQPGFAAPREALLEAFWPDTMPEQSRARLRVGLNRLRQALQQLGCALEAGNDTIRLPGAAIGWADLLAFREHLGAARRLIREQPEAALECCRAGHLLYGGDLFGDASWPWLEQHRAQAYRDLLELLHLWQDAALRTGRTEEAISALEELLTVDPGQEEAVRRLMTLLIRAGRRGDAVRRYRELAQWLKEELGLDPAPETKELMRQALN
ncbi:MAG TPA: BTAD domain-containing putative transcriptional regulator, partial [Symbiobacteriaceae bacterium]|nr:BTAD domain-containing putative transcriptional regulator [Symbiobacteriaceae bacterium]